LDIGAYYRPENIFRIPRCAAPSFLVSEPLKTGRKRVVGRAVWDKKGKYKLIAHLLREVRRELNALKVTQRYMVMGFGARVPV